VVLYCLLTGWPPFQADNPFDALMQVIQRDPVSPRQLNTTVPRHLETVCLKCLEKHPRRRYGSARELVADLGRCLSGQPIFARPTTSWERAAKWARRRPPAAALVVVLMLAWFSPAVVGVVYDAHPSRQRRRHQQGRVPPGDRRPQRNAEDPGNGNLERTFRPQGTHERRQRGCLQP
jgi:serine/threonine protein kinase